MKFFDRKVFLKSLPILFVTGLLLLFTIPSPVKIDSENKTQSTPKVTVMSETNTSTDSAQVNIENGNNSVKVDVNNSVTTNSDSGRGESNGTCKVTKNGVTETVPADQVTIDEESDGDLSIQVDCENNSSTSNNSSSIKNKININASSTP